MIKLGFVLLIAVILVQGMLFWKYQRQVKDICRQLSFLMKHDSNMLITREMDFGGIGELADVLNEWLELAKAGILVNGISITSEELETYFLNLTGGNQNA